MYDNCLSYLNNRKSFRDEGLSVELFTFGAPDVNGNWKDKNGNWNRDAYGQTFPHISNIMRRQLAKICRSGLEATMKLTKIGVNVNKAYLLQGGTSAPSKLGGTPKSNG